MPAEIYVEPNDRYEIIEGVKYMAAAAAIEHNFVIGNLVQAFNHYFRKNKNGVAVQDIDVHLPDGNVFRPDVSVIDDLTALSSDENFNGAPALVVEVLSRSTMKNDLGRKKRLYAANGVEEYWIVDRWTKRIEVYHLLDGHYELDEVYQIYSDAEFDALTDDERAAVKFEIAVERFDGLSVDIRQIFNTWWN